MLSKREGMKRERRKTNLEKKKIGHVKPNVRK
jgi:hypothetical protein